MTELALPRRALAEYAGTAALVAVVVGSGIAAQTLSPHDVGLQLLENSLTTVLGLGVLILVPGPAVTVGRMFSDTFAGISPGDVPAFVVAQLVGGAAGYPLANVLYPARTAG